MGLELKVQSALASKKISDTYFRNGVLHIAFRDGTHLACKVLAFGTKEFVKKRLEGKSITEDLLGR